MKTRKCIECGAESTPFFGFTTGCRYNGGSHRNFEEIETTPEHERNKLQTAYSCCMWYDRAAFKKHASEEIKSLARSTPSKVKH